VTNAKPGGSQAQGANEIEAQAISAWRVPEVRWQHLLPPTARGERSQHDGWIGTQEMHRLRIRGNTVLDWWRKRQTHTWGRKLTGKGVMPVVVRVHLSPFWETVLVIKSVVRRPDEVRMMFSEMYSGTELPKVNEPWPGEPRVQLVRMRARRKWWFWGPWIVKAEYRHVNGA
jgi:hypothetical protein